VLVLLVIAFAGCVGQSEGAQPKDAEPSVNAGPASFDETTGAIEGTVTTEDLAPVPGATIGLLDGSNQTTTDTTGRFVFNRMEPGTYQVGANALGYESQARSVDVQAGAVAPVQFILKELPSEAPYMNTIYEPVQFTALMYKATPMCIYEPLTTVNPTLKTCGGVRLGESPVTTNCAACESHTATNEKYAGFTEKWESIIGEVMWQPQSGATGRGFLFDISAPNVTRGTSGSINQQSPYTWYVGTDDSPIRIMINKTDLEDRGIPESDWNNYPEGEGCTAPSTSGAPNCDWMWRMFAARCDLGFCDEGAGPDYGIMLEGKAEVYFTYFIGEPAPSEFTALPDT
jgi:hypothetical protein